jgi:hypothetical protein
MMLVVCAAKLNRVALAAFLVLCAVTARAQEAQPSAAQPAGESKSKLYQVGSKVGAAFTQPLHPVVEGVATGGGIGAGLGYDFPARGNWRAGSKAVVTLRRYWNAQLDGGYRGDRAQFKAYARARNMTRLYFFGPGPDSAESDMTTFTLRDPVVGIHGSVHAISPVEIGGRLEELWPRAESGRNPAVPSIEQRFRPGDAPGLASGSRFRRYQAFVQVTAPAGSGWTRNQGGAYRVSYDLFDDRDVSRFDFYRVEVEGRHKFAIFKPYHSLTLHGWISSAEAKPGQAVPFFLQQTLGGIRSLGSVDERFLGTDGSTGTLRGFRNLRFRDNNLLLLQAEYRFDVWRLLDATVFVDAGKAVTRRTDLNLSNLKSDYGFSLSAMRGAATVARVDVGFSREGTQFFVDLGGFLR